MNKAIVVDLDGTLLKTNTFLQYIKFVCYEMLKQGDVFRVGIICFLVFLRKIRIISSHEKLKKRILIISKRYTDENRMNKLIKELCYFENKEVIFLLGKYKSMGYVSVLSTAAPCVYAALIGKCYGFNFVCSTAMPNQEEWHENVNEQKKKNTISLLENNSLKLAVMITDHYDDLPLLLLDKEDNFIINPTDKSKKIMEKKHIKCKYIYGE